MTLSTRSGGAAGGLAALAFFALVVAAVLPLFIRRVEHVERPSCARHLKMVVHALSMYSQDYDGHFPVAWQPDPAPPAARISWRVALLPYVKEGRWFTCPQEPLSGGFEAAFPAHPNATAPDDTPSRVLSGGYAMNCVHRQPGPPDSTGWAGRPDPRAVSLAEIRSPTQHIVLCDARPETYLLSSWANAPGFHYDSPAATRHMGGTNYAFADGHVKWFRPADVPCRRQECWWAIQGRH